MPEIRITEHAGETVSFSEGMRVVLQQDVSEGRAGRLFDICGDEISAVLAATGWVFIPSESASSVVVLRVDGQVAALALTEHIVRCADGANGVNLAYLCAHAHEGKGYTKLAVAALFVGMRKRLGVNADLGFVNVQTYKDNAGAIGIAKSLGFKPAPEANFEIQLDSGLRQYVGFYQTSQEVFASCDNYFDRIMREGSASIIFDSIIPDETEEDRIEEANKLEVAIP